MFDIKKLEGILNNFKLLEEFLKNQKIDPAPQVKNKEESIDKLVNLFEEDKDVDTLDKIFAALQKHSVLPEDFMVSIDGIAKNLPFPKLVSNFKKAPAELKGLIDFIYDSILRTIEDREKETEPKNVVPMPLTVFNKFSKTLAEDRKLRQDGETDLSQLTQVVNDEDAEDTETEEDSKPEAPAESVEVKEEGKVPVQEDTKPLKNDESEVTTEQTEGEEQTADVAQESTEKTNSFSVTKYFKPKSDSFLIFSHETLNLDTFEPVKTILALNPNNMPIIESTSKLLSKTGIKIGMKILRFSYRVSQSDLALIIEDAMTSNSVEFESNLKSLHTNILAIQENLNTNFLSDEKKKQILESAANNPRFKAIPDTLEQAEKAISMMVQESDTTAIALKVVLGILKKSMKTLAVLNKLKKSHSIGISDELIELLDKRLTIANKQMILKFLKTEFKNKFAKTEVILEVEGKEETKIVYVTPVRVLLT